MIILFGTMTSSLPGLGTDSTPHFRVSINFEKRQDIYEHKVTPKQI